VGIPVADSSQIRILFGRVLANAKDLKRISITSVLEAEILTYLVEGRRTVGELTDQIFGLKRMDPSYHTYYMKVRRTIRDLQRKGYVATNLFGKEKPYRLTPHAVAAMMDVGDRSPRVIPMPDRVIYGGTVGLGLANILLAGFSRFLSRPYMILVYTMFVFLTGYSFSRLTVAFRKVR